jgi:hypothetical protein
MALHPRPVLLAVLCAAALAAGCARESASPVATEAPVASAPAATRGRFAGSIDLEAARARMKQGHPYFPLTPGRYVDLRVRRLGEDPEFSYVRATLGEPELFFGRLATPLVYGEVPGMFLDDTLEGLRQYFSIAPDGSLWMHGAQNQGVMSHTEPPVRQLLADPRPGDTWEDTVYFESFLPGMIPFWQNHEHYVWTLSERATLDLPVGRVKAMRVSAVITDAEPPAAAMALAALYDGLLPSTAPRPAGDPDIPAMQPRLAGAKPELPILKGLWFARHEGLVARDYPFGRGPENWNIVTIERIGEGVGPVPDPQPAP